MEDAVQVWQIPLDVSDDTLDKYFICLASNEQDKANRFRFPRDRRRFIVARGTLRYLLGHEIGRSPAAVEFGYGQYGKPFVLCEGGKNGALGEKTVTGTASCSNAAVPEPEGSFHFNLSHSGELALCALGRHRLVGIDLEEVRMIQRLPGMMERCFSSAEQAQVEQAPPQSQSCEFLRRWTCKEAYLKAIGMGLSQSMQTVEVALEPACFKTVPYDCAQGWSLQLIALPAGYVGALAIAGPAPVTMHHWRHDALR